ncbi:SusE domain-containing protein [Psychroflexus salis]|nr:SusE domain-containing protein [Psychroflexus salis]
MKMKNKISVLIAAFIVSLSFNACTDDDNLRFQTVENPEQITFLNNFLPEYVLSEETENNNAERFLWASPDFGAPTAVNYFLETSADGTFTEENTQVITSTSETQVSVSVSQMMDLAEAKGLSNNQVEDENGELVFDENGDPVYNNVGELFFRVRADLGDNAENSPETTSAVQVINVRILLAPVDGGDEGPTGDCELDQLWLVGAGVPDAGWGWGSPVQLLCTGDNVYSGNVNFSPENDGNFRFFTEEGNWDSGINFPGFVDEGFTVDEVFQDAQDGDNNFQFIGDAGIYFLTVDYNNMTISVGPEQTVGVCDLDQYWLVGAGVPDAGWGWGSPVSVACTGDNVYSGNVNFSPDNDGNFRFFTEEGNWDSGQNFPYFVEEGFTIDPLFQDAQDGDNNFQFIGEAGTYFLTVDMGNKVITLE